MVDYEFNNYVKIGDSWWKINDVKYWQAKVLGDIIIIFLLLLFYFFTIWLVCQGNKMFKKRRYWWIIILTPLVFYNIYYIWQGMLNNLEFFNVGEIEWK